PQALLSEIYESFVPAAYEKKIDFKSSIDIARNIHCISDTFRIRQIVDNLLSNAFKFTPRNGKIVLAASISNNKQQPELIISIKDSGIGIKEQDKEHIFESFKRLNHKELIAEGSGLGLAITQKLVELLGGKISVESKLGKGSLFKVNIPVSDVTKKEDVPPEKKSLIPKENMTVLFVDDDSIQLNLFSEFMKKEKIKAFTCSSYDEALAVLQKESFDIIFSDIQMGDRDGFELVDYIRHSDTIKGKKEIPIIALTGQMEFSITRYLHAGFSDFLLKPFTYNQLIKLINKYIPTSTCKEEKEKPQKKASFNALLEFAGGDKHAEKKIIDSFIHETSKNYQALKAALEDKNTNEIKKIAHKMTPTMRMISENTIADLLQSYEQGIENKEDESLLLKLIAEKIREAEQFFERNN
ncbi:MAG: response regulator, partial [Dysgonamonadaceae bacterium]|nr:response regulator [Dysgonamonadaceae bacterium]